MIDFAVTRARLREVLSTVTVTYPGTDEPRPIEVYEWAVDGPIALPAIFIGLPEVEFRVQPCIDKVELPIAVAVGRSGADDKAMHQELEQLWPRVAEVLDAAVPAEFLDIGTNAEMTRAQFVPIGIQGQTYPAQEITLEIYG